MDYKVEILPVGGIFPISLDNTILNAALVNNLPLEHSCLRGDCGLCKATLISGKVKNELGEIVSSGNILTCCSYAQSDLCLEATYIPELAHIQCVTLPCKIEEFNMQGDVLILYLKIPPAQKIIYLAGQYIDLIYKSIRRSYSLANASTTSSGLELHIKIIPGGAFSELIKSECSIGQLMRLEGPKGTFFVRQSESPLIFVAGGTGFAPVKAMVEDLLASETKRIIYVYWGMVHGDDFYTSIGEDWPEKYNNVHFIPVVSGDDEVWSGRKGLVHQAVLNDFSDLSCYHTYACGSPSMISSVKETFIAQGLKEEHFYSDVFVPSK